MQYQHTASEVIWLTLLVRPSDSHWTPLGDFRSQTSNVRNSF